MAPTASFYTAQNPHANQTPLTATHGPHSLTNHSHSCSHSHPKISFAHHPLQTTASSHPFTSTTNMTPPSLHSSPTTHTQTPTYTHSSSSNHTNFHYKQSTTGATHLPESSTNTPTPLLHYVQTPPPSSSHSTTPPTPVLTIPYSHSPHYTT